MPGEIGSTNKIRLGIIRGGEGRQYWSSLDRGGQIISHILENLLHRVEPVDILVDKEGVWHANGLPIEPADLMYRVDAAWNTSHSAFSAVLGNLSIPNAGNRPFSLALQENPDLLRQHLREIKVPMPRSILFPLYQADFDGPRDKYAMKKAREVFGKFSSPWIVKTYTPDAHMGMHVAKTFPELVEAIEDGVRHQKSILVEEMIMGRVGSIHSLRGFRGEDVYTLPLPPVGFSRVEKEKLHDFAKDLHRHLEADNYLKSDFVMNSRGQIYLLSIESTPDLRENSHFGEACGYLGLKPHHLALHMIERALK